MNDGLETRAELLDEVQALRRRVDELEADRRRLSFLTEASTVLTSTLDYEERLRRVTQLAVPRIASWCAVDLLDANSELQRLAVAHTDRAKGAWAFELSHDAADPDAPAGVYRVLRSGTSALYANLDGAARAEAVRESEHLQVLHALNFTSAMIVPLTARERTFGAITFASTEPRRRYGPDDLALAEEFARRAALVIDNARLYAEMRQSRDEIEVILGGVGDGITVQDRTGRLQYANDPAALICGYPSAAALLAAPLAEVVGRFELMDEHGQPFPLDRLPGRLALQGQHPDATLLRFRVLATGEEHWSIVRAAPVLDERGAVVLAINTFQDVTVIKQTQEALARYQILAEQARDILLFIDSNGRIIEANAAAAAAYGYTRDELTTLSIYDLRAPESQLLVTTQMAIAERTGSLFETMHRRRDGRTFPVEVSSRGALIGGKRILVSIIRDITERNRAAERERFLAEASGLLAASLDYEAILQALAHLAVTTIADWCTVHVFTSDGMLQPIAIAHREPAVEAHVRASFDQYADQIVPQVLRGGRPVLDRELKEELPRALGLVSTICVSMRQRGRVLGAITLISADAERRYGVEDLALAEELAHRAGIAVDNARLYREAQEAIRLRDEFLSIASHELKTPLTSLMGYAQMLQRRLRREGGFDERNLRALDVIVGQSGRLSKMVAALLDISRIHMGQLTIERQTLDLCALAQRVIDELQPTLVQHTIDCAARGAVLVVGDELRLEQVLHNLIQNAIKYSPSGGPVRVLVEHDGARAHIAISDTGIGIPAAALPHLFQRFYRAANVDEKHISGLGVGLFVVKEIVMLHEGEVAVASEEGAGSTFSVWLPLAQEHPPSGAELSLPGAEGA
jgi:PAS domain S-box-containing protein